MVYDCVGVGVGPANLSLACLAEAVPDFDAIFLEGRSDFVWHGGMQIPGALIQVSHFKDLVTLADPTNKYTFVNFLKEKGRLYQFLNARFESVLRKEFQEYLAWAFFRNPLVRPGQTVSAVNFDGEFRVDTSAESLRTKSVVVGVGRVPAVPACTEHIASPNMIHASRYRDALPDPTGRSICVVGGGQSGAEVFHDLIARQKDQLPRHVSWVSRRPNFAPIDDSPFANELFTPQYSDAFFHADEARRRDAIAQFKLASDGISESTLV
jgi:lysine N6-hydroxylase